MSHLIISVSGIRGIVGDTLVPDAALAFAAALATHTKGGKIVVSNDGRPSGPMLKHAVLAGLLGAGCEVHDLGVAPTPTFGVAIRKLQAAGGVQITASHNPAPWNGLKLFGSNGAVLSAADGQKIRQIFESGQFHRVPWDQLGRVHDCPQALDWHRERVLQLVDVTRIRSQQFKALVDANGGSGGRLARQLLESLQVKTTILGDKVGEFLHEPEPIAANLTTVCPKVPEMKSDLGLVLDPDADRLAIIDETGRYIGEELTLALAVAFRLRQQRGPVVINMSTSRVIEDIAEQHGVSCHRSAVGEANVVALMNEVGAVIGGEGNGGVIDPRVGWVRDPFIGMGLILNLLADTGKKLSALVGELPGYTIVKDKYTVTPERLPQLFDALTKRWPQAKANRIDGLRLDWEDRWVHVRPSNTEPIVRVIAEAPAASTAQELCVAVGEMLQPS
ncbi:MAG TPA: phosphoglucosamine mutase [Gemmataceae bacterium]|nr:phosphoglucosamine mutase [Gemmataceae bacterium]